MTTKEKVKEFLNDWQNDHPFLTSVIASIVASAIVGIGGIFFAVPKVVLNTMDSDEYLDKLQVIVNNNGNMINSNINSDNNNNNNNNNSSNSADVINNNYYYGTVQLDRSSYCEDFSDFLESTISIEDNDVTNCKVSFNEDEIVAKDISGKEYYSGDLIGKQIVLEYYDEEDDKNVFFQGMFNENYHWDGKCTTNSYYLDGRFYGACESEFDDGIRKNYKSIIASDANLWCYADKVCGDLGNDGINISYSGDTNMILNDTNVDVSIVSVNYIMDFLNPFIRINSYYNGITIDEAYNDNSGNAYLVKFDTDGNVILLYQGPFSKGYMHTENSEYEGWEIVYSDEYDNYYCNEGIFINGRADSPSSSSVTVDEIEKYVNDKNIDVDVNLMWK